MDQIPYEMVRNRILTIATTTLKTTNFIVHIEDGTKKGDNFIGIIYRVRIRCGDKEEDGKKCNGMENPRNLNLIVKVPPENPIRREKFFARPSFLREALAYDNILPAFVRFQESKGIPLEEGFHEFVECYGTITKDGSEAIIMRDLSEQDYKMYNRHDYIAFDHVIMIMKILGKFHAISYAMKDQCPDDFIKYRHMEDLFKERENDEQLQNYFKMIVDRAISTFNLNEHQSVIDKITEMFKTKSLLDHHIEITNGANAEPYAIVCHGDCWNNNILYRYRGDKLIAARLIDWQVMRYSSPVTDILYFIFLSTSRDMRKKYYNEFLDTYYTSLASFLKRLGSDPEILIPRHAFEMQLKKFGKFGFIMSVMILPIITTHAEDVPDLDEISERIGENMEGIFSSANSKDVYEERIRGVTFDMLDMGYM